MTASTWTAVAEALSFDRLAPYRDLCDGDTARAIELYAWNAQLAAAFQVPLGQLEVVIRNALHDALSIRAGTQRWWESSQLGIDSGLIKLIQTKLGELKISMRRRGRRPMPGDLVSALSFGTWCSLLDKRHEDLWRRVLRDAFPHLPPRTKRAGLRDQLDHMRRFRNRVAHLEPIYRRDLAADYDTILRCTAFVSPQTAIWVDDLSRVVEVRQQRPPVR